MITEIGLIAGDIWHFLEKRGRSRLEDIASGIGKPRDHVLMSVGWLAREGHVCLTRDGGFFYVQLTERLSGSS